MPTRSPSAKLRPSLVRTNGSLLSVASGRALPPIYIHIIDRLGGGAG